MSKLKYHGFTNYPNDGEAVSLMRLKVMPLDAWMRYADELEDTLDPRRYEPVPARFNRPGIYLDGEQCWFELADGRAFSYPATSFRHNLAMQHAWDLRPEQIDGLAAIVKARLATRRQRDMFYAYENAVITRAVGRGAEKLMLKSGFR